MPTINIPITNKIPHVKDCIEYIQNCGYTYKGYNCPWYLFESVGNRVGPLRVVHFTLHEIREAVMNGF